MNTAVNIDAIPCITVSRIVPYMLPNAPEYRKILKRESKADIRIRVFSRDHKTSLASND